PGFSIKQSQTTGDIKPKRQGGNSPPKVQGADLVTLTEILEHNNDTTLEELGELLLAETGIQVSGATMGRISQKYCIQIVIRVCCDKRQQANLPISPQPPYNPLREIGGKQQERVSF
ncbi:MAG: hypothetical protein F6K10_32235, partial [Moorea sp. SIO2B7]|nr:hypothetical protein [Moorena sp. SIO2B7]